MKRLVISKKDKQYIYREGDLRVKVDYIKDRDDKKRWV